jgi:hypothetical protein
MTSQATLRFLGHMGRNGGNLWALKAAERYFPEGHLLLKAYRSRCHADPTRVVEQHDQDLSAQKSKIHIAFAKTNDVIQHAISRRSTLDSLMNLGCHAKADAKWHDITSCHRNSPHVKTNRTDPFMLFSTRNFTSRKEALRMMTLNRRPLN